MSKKPPKIKVERDTIQIALRLSPSEKELLDQLIKRAERRAGMFPGTLAAAAYARSALLDFMARALKEIEEEKEEGQATGPSVWDWIKRGPEILPMPGTKARKP
jgi:hypothetical protein